MTQTEQLERLEAERSALKTDIDSRHERIERASAELADLQIAAILDGRSRTKSASIQARVLEDESALAEAEDKLRILSNAIDRLAEKIRQEELEASGVARAAAIAEIQNAIPSAVQRVLAATAEFESALKAADDLAWKSDQFAGGLAPFRHPPRFAAPAWISRVVREWACHAHLESVPADDQIRLEFEHNAQHDAAERKRIEDERIRFAEEQARREREALEFQAKQVAGVVQRLRRHEAASVGSILQ